MYGNIKDEGKMPSGVKKMMQPVYPEQSRYPDPRIQIDHNFEQEEQLVYLGNNEKYKKVGVSDGFIEG